MPADHTAPDATARWADPEEFLDGVVDVHLPSSGETADVVVLLHGGFWKARWDRRHTRPLARALAEAGFVVATPEYRRVGNGGGWPLTSYDVRAGLARIPGLVRDLGVTPGRTIAVGHSAGGHLALGLGDDVDRVVALAPVADLAEARARGLGDGAVAAFMGAHPDEEANPRTHLQPGAPVTILHGRHDDTVPIALSERLVSAHPWVDLRPLEIGHYEFLDPAHPVVTELITTLREPVSAV